MRSSLQKKLTKYPPPQENFKIFPFPTFIFALNILSQQAKDSNDAIPLIPLFSGTFE